MKDLCSTLFGVPTSAVASAPAAGRLLVSEPFLDEDCFSHSVATLLDYEPRGGAMGVVLNHCTHSLLADVLDSDAGVRVDVPVYCGGPLALDRLYFLHTLGSDIVPGSRPSYAEGLYVGGDFDAMIDYINSGYNIEGCVRFFVGYSSWEAGQLESEIAEGTWAVSESPTVASELLSGTGDAYWHRRVRALGSAYRAWRLVPRVSCVN